VDMSIDLFDDGNFPVGFDKEHVKEDMENVKTNRLLVHGADISTLAKLYVLVEASMINGGYDGKYLYVMSGKNSLPDMVEAVKSLLDTYNITYTINATSLFIPKKNSEINFATYDAFG